MSDEKVTRASFVLMSNNPAHNIILNKVVELINGLGVGVNIARGDINDLTPERKLDNLEKHYRKLNLEYSQLKAQTHREQDKIENE